MGQQQRKERDRDTARASASELFKAGNYEGAETGLMTAGLYDEAQAFGSAGERRKAAEKQKTYGETFKTGGWTGLGEMAAGQGDFETAGYAQGQARAKTLQDWEDHDRAITVQKQGVEFLATSAGQLRNLPLEARGQAAMDIIAKSPFADNPQVMQAVQQAAADGRITDEELTQFEEQMLTYAQKLEGQRWQKSFDQGVTESQRSYDLQAELGRGGLAMDRERLNIAKDAAQAEATAADGPNVDDEGQFRREYNTITKEFRDVQSAFGRIRATDPNTPAGQISLVFQYMKMLDPGSTVREGEFATAENARGVPEGVMNTYNKIMAGKRLTPEQVGDFKAQATQLYGQALESYDTTRKTYEGIAGEYGFGVDRTVPDLATMRDYKPKTFLERGKGMLPKGTQPIMPTGLEEASDDDLFSILGGR
jgi:hypothetical protein